MDAPNPMDESSSNSTNDTNNGSPFLVYYDQGVYDLTDFAHKHPGGRNTLSGLHNRDIAKRLQAAPPHSPAAMYLMQEYRVANKADINNNSKQAEEDSNIKSQLQAENEDELISLQNKSDESMEVIVM